MSENDSGSDLNVDNQQTNSSRKRKAYSMETKLEAVERYFKISASRKINVHRKMIQKWVEQEKNLRDSQ